MFSKYVNVPQNLVVYRLFFFFFSTNRVLSNRSICGFFPPGENAECQEAINQLFFEHEKRHVSHLGCPPDPHVIIQPSCSDDYPTQNDIAKDTQGTRYRLSRQKHAFLGHASTGSPSRIKNGNHVTTRRRKSRNRPRNGSRTEVATRRIFIWNFGDQFIFSQDFGVTACFFNTKFEGFNGRNQQKTGLETVHPSFESLEGRQDHLGIGGGAMAAAQVVSVTQGENLSESFINQELFPIPSR